MLAAASMSDLTLDLAAWLWCARWQLGTRRACLASFAPDYVAWPLEQIFELQQAAIQREFSIASMHP